MQSVETEQKGLKIVSSLAHEKNATFFSPFLGFTIDNVFVPSVLVSFKMYEKINKREITADAVFRKQFLMVYGNHASIRAMKIAIHKNSGNRSSISIAGTLEDGGDDPIMAYTARALSVTNMHFDYIYSNIISSSGPPLFNKMQFANPLKFFELMISLLNAWGHYELTKWGLMIQQEINKEDNSLHPFLKIIGYAVLILVGILRLLFQLAVGSLAFVVRAIASPFKSFNDCYAIHPIAGYMAAATSSVALSTPFLIEASCESINTIIIGSISMLIIASFDFMKEAYLLGWYKFKPPNSSNAAYRMASYNHAWTTENIVDHLTGFMALPLILIALLLGLISNKLTPKISQLVRTRIALFSDNLPPSPESANVLQRAEMGII